MDRIDPSFRFWTGGRFDAQKAGRQAIPVKDDVGVWRDLFTGAPCDAPPELDEDAPFELCTICRTKHHPRWHQPEWRAAVWDAVNAAKALGNAARFDRLREIVANTPFYLR